MPRQHPILMTPDTLQDGVGHIPSQRRTAAGVDVGTVHSSARSATHLANPFIPFVDHRRKESVELLDEGGAFGFLGSF